MGNVKHGWRSCHACEKVENPLKTAEEWEKAVFLLKLKLRSVARLV
jgi:hypothetical protein